MSFLQRMRLRGAGTSVVAVMMSAAVFGCAKGDENPRTPEGGPSDEPAWCEAWCARDCTPDCAKKCVEADEGSRALGCSAELTTSTECQNAQPTTVACHERDQACGVELRAWFACIQTGCQESPEVPYCKDVK